MDEAFKENQENKMNELKNRMEKCLDDRKKYSFQQSTAKSQLEKTEEDLKVLTSRLESMEPALDPNGYVFYVSPEEKVVDMDEAMVEAIEKLAPILKLNAPVAIEMLKKGTYTIKIDTDGVYKDTEMADDETIQKVIGLDKLSSSKLIDKNTFQYNGDMKWHQIVDKMIKLGFKQDPEYDKLCGSPSYQSETEESIQTPTNTSGEAIPQEVAGEKDTEFKAKTIKSFENETIVLIDACGPIGSSDIEIDDDESSCDLYVGGVKIEADVYTSGFVNILTLGEFERVLKSDAQTFKDCERFFTGVIVPNFTGDIQVVVLSDGEYQTDFDETNFITHQFDGNVGVGINFPEGTKVYELNEDFTYPVQVIRNEKLENVLGDE